MRTVLSSAALMLALAAGPAQAIDPFFPSFGNAGIDVRHYDVELAVGKEPESLQGHAKLIIVAEARLTAFTLDLHALKVSQVKIDGRKARFAKVGDKLRIVPTKPIAKGARFVAEVWYGGDAVPLQDPTLPDDPEAKLGWMTHEDAAFVLSEPVGASTFFPANDELDDKATFSFRITAPEPLTVAANGTFVKSADLGSRRRFDFEMKQPMTTWLATVQVNRFDVTKATIAGGIPMRIYTPAGDDQDVEGLLKAREMVPYFAGLFGAYPFDDYGSVTIADPTLHYALETQTLSAFPVGAGGNEAIVAHELAHQWFGNSVSVAAWKDLWLAEGFATYCEVLWPNRSDRAAFTAEMEAIYADVVKKKVGPAVVDKPEDIFSDRTYMRGAMALYAIEREVGQPMLLKIMKTWASTYRYKSADSQDFIDLAVKVSGKPALRAILKAWLYEEGVPELPGVSAAAAADAGPRKPLVGDLRAAR